MILFLLGFLALALIVWVLAQPSARPTSPIWRDDTDDTDDTDDAEQLPMGNNW